MDQAIPRDWLFESFGKCGKDGELENKIKAKEKELAKVSNKLEEADNSLADRENKMQKKLGTFCVRGVDYDCSNTVPNNSLRPTAVEQKKANECEMRPLVVDDLEADEYVMELPVTEDSEVCSSGTYFRAMVKNYPTLLKNHKEEAFI